MSLVVAIKQNGRVYLGADTQATCGYSRETYKNKNNYKIWNVRDADHCLMAHVGSSKNSNVVRLIHDMVTKMDEANDAVCFDFVYNKIFPMVIDSLKDAEFLNDEKLRKEGMGSSFFFAYKDQLFLLNSDRSLFEVDDICAIGSGESEAYGSLLSTDGEDPEVRIVKALTAGSKRNIFVSYPIIITDTETQKYRILNDKSVKKMLSDKTLDSKSESNKKVGGKQNQLNK